MARRDRQKVGKDGRVSDLEQQLARIAERDEEVRAWVSRHSDDDIRSMATTAPEGPLHGWTLGVKDVIDTADLPTERGSPIYAGRRTTNDAACVAVARQSGATVMGKTVTTEFALFTPGPTRNPHNLEHTPGGSSSGSAAAVADGQVRAAFGTQTVGSVLRPAAYCGCVGFKPTHQLVPLTGVATLSHAFDTIGWFTTDVADATVMLQALTGADAVAPARRLRVGYYRSHQWDSGQPELAAIMDAAAAQLRAADIDVLEFEPLPELATAFDDANAMLHYEIARVFEWERRHHYDNISQLVQKMLARSDGIGHDRYREAHLALSAARQAYDSFMVAHGLDALLTPSAPGEAPPLKTTGDSVFNRVWTALGVPAVHLPTGTGPGGLPVGVQLTGRFWRDPELLSVARAAESAFGSL